MKPAVIGLLFAASLSGCMVGPDYRRPDIEAPAAWRLEKAEAGEISNLAWWEQFQDPVLARLVGQALENNKDLEIATANVDQAFAQYGLTPAAQVPELERQVARQENFISVLLGRNPGPIARGREIEALLFPAVPGGLPESLLERRPDIRQAEQNLIAANADIGVAKAAYFPRISLTALFGRESAELSDLFKGPSKTWSYGAGVTLPIFNAGRISNQVAQSEAVQRQALSAYQKSIIVAFQDVENA